MLDRFKKLNEMRSKAKAELEEIPRGNFRQNMLRLFYWDLRLHSLGKKAKEPMGKIDVFKKSVENVRREYPDFVAGCKVGSEFEKTGLCSRKVKR